ncbi:hypothetical protein, partial [Caballeronia choica]|uniref:hypothetical protein n=1 Tax=Caballeronia choica TaxID=326476 RepID=UPI001F2EC345
FTKSFVGRRARKPIHLHGRADTCTTDVMKVNFQESTTFLERRPDIAGNDETEHTETGAHPLRL